MTTKEGHDSGTHPFMDVLSKFQKIRQKHTRQNVYANSKPPPPEDNGSLATDADGRTSMNGSDSITGRRGRNPLTEADLQKFIQRNRVHRRWSSFPSVLKMPVNGSASSTRYTNGRLHDQAFSSETPQFSRYRRSSFPRTPFEYELAKIYEEKAKLLVGGDLKRAIIRRRRATKQDRKERDEDEVNENWKKFVLGGKDLHAFYSFWDRPKYLNRNKDEN
ncbi:uncharacterized protein LOC127855587 isoform X1 [Dreissena polymorpha]|uniref:Uncharacterized protein n=1 Tax=Dreissena polymorpha TaxID=45954 RepID=A0A9D4BZZ8_DREPO|nr:uncharacterized protein LOC127855587 isoform X1 [Dreissena polymorpha]KAH3714746.1 hypothetical protein DPMN_057445 [Dreissena polymorpha]